MENNPYKKLLKVGLFKQACWLYSNYFWYKSSAESNTF